MMRDHERFAAQDCLTAAPNYQAASVVEWVSA